MNVRSLLVVTVFSLFLASCGAPTPAVQPLDSKETLDAKAAAGDPNAMFELGAYYHDGSSGAQDIPLSLEWFTKAAALGEPRSQFNLGVMYYEGQGVKQDFAKAMELFQASADLGNSRAQFNLGVMYYRGEGVAQDFDKAHRLFTSAALQGFNEAMFNLGVMHAKGESVTPDTGVAYAWFSVAKDYGNPNAAEVMATIETDATADQKKALVKVAKELKEQVDETIEKSAEANQ